MVFIDSEKRLRFVVYAPCALSPFSVLGSCLTLTAIFRSWRIGIPLKTYHRLLLGMSFFDLLKYTAMTFGPLAMPKDEFPVDFGQRGNRATCLVQASMLQIGTASWAYAAMLMLHYFLIISLGTKDKKMAKIELLMHFIPISYYTATVVLGLVWGVFNANGAFCWVEAYPYRCHKIEGVECIRGGEKITLFTYGLFVSPLLVWTGVLLFSSLFVCASVWWRQHKRQRFEFARRGSVANIGATQRTRLVLTQCFLYGRLHVNWLTWSGIRGVAGLAGANHEKQRELSWVLAVNATFSPLVGAFNFLIFMRPRYLSSRRAHAGMTRWYCLKEAIWNPTHPVGLKRGSMFVPSASGSRRTTSDFISGTSRGCVASQGLTKAKGLAEIYHHSDEEEVSGDSRNSDEDPKSTESGETPELLYLEEALSEHW